jgi:hypothetical protein
MRFQYNDGSIAEWEASPAVLVQTVGGYPGALCAVKEKCVEFLERPGSVTKY